MGENPRVRLATTPTPLEWGPLVGSRGSSVRLWVKRDDLTGLGMGGNKARKLEFLMGAARAAGAGSIVTVGAAQSNHCRMTAAAGAILGMPVHLVLAGDRPVAPTGNQLLSELFGAQLHFTGAPESHWGELEIAREALVDELGADGTVPFAIPIGGSTPTGALGYVEAFSEMLDQCDDLGIEPAAVVFASSSGGTHAGLLAGRALAAAQGRTVPELIAVGVAKGVLAGMPDVAELARQTLDLLGSRANVDSDDVVIDDRWIGEDYAIPTAAADAAIGWAARAGGWVLDRVYSGKGMSGVLGLVEDRRWPDASDVIFIHTGGIPAVFAPGGSPSLQLR